MTARTSRVARGAQGFTFVELAVTLLIVALLLGGVLIPLQTQVEIRKIEDTQRLLEQAREALLAYAASNGYFPCPATATSNGQEPPGHDHATGACGPLGVVAGVPTEYVGFLPAALLGFSPVDAQGFALDGWGGSAANRIRYAVSYHTVSGIAVPFTRSGGMATLGIPTLGGLNAFHICGDGAAVVPDTNCGAQTLASNAVAVIWSSGPNAIGAPSSVHEAENPSQSGGSADRIFVSRVRATSGADEFDDQLIWISTFAVVRSLVASGQLP